MKDTVQAPGLGKWNLSQSECVKRVCCREDKFGFRPFESEVTVSHKS